MCCTLSFTQFLDRLSYIGHVCLGEKGIRGLCNFKRKKYLTGRFEQ